MGRRRFWTEAEMQLMRDRYPHERSDKIAAELGREVAQVHRKAALMGLRKTKEFLQSEESGRLLIPGRRILPNSIATRFVKGGVPHNKGLRRPGYAPGRMKETQFKQGQRSGIAAQIWKPVGTIVVDTDGYQRIKLREVRRGERLGFGNQEVWPLLHRHLWETANGRKVPPGHAVVFKDGNRQNCVLENLELITRAELAQRNRMWGRLPRELSEAIHLTGQLKRWVKDKQKKRENQNHGEKHDC